MNFLKPVAYTVIRYRPGARNGVRRLPDSLLLADIVALVARLLTVTAAFATAAPVASVIVPVRLARTYCEKASGVQVKIASAAISLHK
jgi:hypothetical protein